MKFTVAIDGPAASGKGTISKAVAERFGFAHLDTGLLYRSVGIIALDTRRDPAEVAANLTVRDLLRDDLRTGEAGQAASRVATDPAVRRALVDFQRDFARRPGGAVLDGRDIGTVICPEAEVKLFVTASAEERARRRHAELAASGDTRSPEEVLADVRARDERDMGRKEAPLRPAEDAVALDTSEMSVAEAVAAAVRVTEERMETNRAD